MNKTIQVGVIGSMLDVEVKLEAEIIANELGDFLAKEKMAVLFGYEGDFNSLSFVVAKRVCQKGGRCVAFLRGDIELEEVAEMTRIKTGQQRGGGREFPFILSCDVIVAINGGSGTLMEIAMAYQAGIPVIALRSSGGWSEKLADKFLDDRNKLKIIGVDTAEEAVNKIKEIT